MKARAGDVYTVFNNYLGRYTACQVAYIAPPDAVSKQPGAVILSLDWVGDAPLTRMICQIYARSTRISCTGSVTSICCEYR